MHYTYICLQDSSGTHYAVFTNQKHILFILCQSKSNAKYKFVYLFIPRHKTTDWSSVYWLLTTDGLGQPRRKCFFFFFFFFFFFSIQIILSYISLTWLHRRRVIFQALLWCRDIQMLGRSSIKWRQRPDMILNVDWVVNVQYN